MPTKAPPTHRPVVLLSHRGPVSFRRVRGQRRVSRGGGGLVTALMGLAGSLGDDAVWVCAAATAEDRKVVEEYGDRPVRIALAAAPHIVGEGEAADDPIVTTRMVAVDKRRHDEFYGVIANPLLWFVQHGLYGQAEQPILTSREHTAYTRGYLSVNRKFADAVIAQVKQLTAATGKDPIVLLQDYHFYLVAKRVRAACPGVTITHFVHIPWPGPNEWRVLPPEVREQLLRGLLGCDIVSFHTRRFARNFLLCCQEVLGLDIDLRAMAVDVEDRRVQVRYYPISVDPPSLEQLAKTRPVARHRSRLAAAYQGDDRQLVLRVDRTDPSKNIVRGFRAFDVLLTDHPELHGRVTFYALLQPSRQDVPEYSDYIGAIGSVVAEVNARHTGDGWQPIVLQMENDMSLAVAAYSLADVLLVNAVNDGMNLVAKEMPLVNRRDGVLVLSENTGAHEELGPYAVTVHPFDVQQQAEALYEALTLPAEERHRMLAGAVDVVRRHDVHHWLAAQLADIAALDAPEPGEPGEQPEG
jgi:trehalose 6-phosphate synthase